MKRIGHLFFAAAIGFGAANLRASSLSVLPLGDSITAGYAYYNLGPGYRDILLNYLNDAGISIQYQGVLNPTASNDYGYSADLVAANQNYNDGFAGFGSEDILNNLDADVPSIYTTYPNAGGYWLTGGNGTGRAAMFPDIVLLMIGINDGTSRGGAATVDPNDLAILQWFAANRPNTQVIAAAPTAGTGATDLANSLAANSYLQSIIPSEFPQDRIANVIGTFQNPDGTLNTSLLSPDGLHPLDTGYVQIANAFFAPIISSVLSTRHGTVMQMPTLPIAGFTDHWVTQIDVGDNDLIIANGDLETITNQIKSGLDLGTGSEWTGNGLASSAAANDTTHLTALGVIENNPPSGTPIYSTFDGTPATAGSILIRYTDYGDANLDGTVDGSDYSLIDNGYLNALTGWYNGDFNYDGVIDGSDYTLIDNAFNNDSGEPTIAISTAQIAGHSSVPEPSMTGWIALGTAFGVRRCTSTGSKTRS